MSWERDKYFFSHVPSVLPYSAQHLPFTKKSIRNFKHPQKIFEILATPQKNPHSVPPGLPISWLVCVMHGFIMLINVKMQTNAGILTFMSRINFVPS